MTWKTLTNEQKTHLIQTVWRENISANEIGMAVGCSRNAVIGHYRRHPDGLESAPLRVSVAELSAKKESKPKIEKPTKKPKPLKFKSVAPEMPVFDITSTDGYGLYVTMADNNGCMWPLNDGGPYLFCGYAKLGKYSYCPHHHVRSMGSGTEGERRALSVLRAQG